MTTTHAESNCRFYRDRDRAMLGGVCAGLANYLDLNLKVTRILAFIAFLMAMPVAVIAYVAAVFLIPSGSSGVGERHRRRQFCGRRRSRRRQRRRERVEPIETETPRPTTAAEISERCSSMDQRLARLEKHVTSTRFQIDQELGRL